jgi:hypothetical protein
VCDGWQHAGQGTFAVQTFTTLAASGLGNMMMSNITTAEPTLGANDYLMYQNLIEGYRIRRLGFGSAGPQPLTVAFYSAHHRTGLYSVAVRNKDATRSCVMTYTHAVADAYQYNVITFPGCPDGVWDATNGLGMQLVFTHACGATFTAPATGGWYNANYLGAPGQVNGVGTTADVSRIACVLALPGTLAPTAARAPLITRTYDHEYLLARRYWWCSNPRTPKGEAVGSVSGESYENNVVGLVPWRFTVPMRIVPAMSVWNNGVQNQLRNTITGALSAGGGISISYLFQEGGCILGINTLPTGNWFDFDLIADARF